MEFTNRTYGVEIEILTKDTEGRNLSTTLIAMAINSKGIPAEAQSYNHRVQSIWKVTTDSSCGFEIVSPVLSGEEGLAQIKKVCEALNSIGAKVDKSCGLHVHVGANDLTKSEIAKVFYLYTKYEPVFDHLNPPSRRGNNNQYCKSLASVHEEINGSSKSYKELLHNPVQFFYDEVGSRYYKLNLDAYTRYGTVEFRQHSGTTDPEKITNWVILVVGFVEKARKAYIRKSYNQVSFALFLEWLHIIDSDSNPLISNLSRYLKQRYSALNSGVDYYMALS